MTHVRRILVSAYACEPNSGSEPGAGYSILRAAAHYGECWVLTRTNNIHALSSALRDDPPPHPVHPIPVDLSPTLLRVKAKVRSIRAYYALWQRRAAQVAEVLNSQIHFDVIHHATFSTFWLPVGVFRLPEVADRLVVGPISGWTFTPRPLLQYLGWKGLISDTLRYVVIHASAVQAARRFRNVAAVLVQNDQMQEFAWKRLVGDGPTVTLHPNASDPGVTASPSTSRRTEILAIGQLKPLKGWALALRVFAESQLPDDYVLSFVGDGPDRARLERLAGKWDVHERVRFLGTLPRHEVLNRMSDATALLFPSFHDSAGFAVSEALALGLPVVCLDHGGPGALTRLWPQSPSAAIRVVSRRQVITDMASALREYALTPAAIPDEVHKSIVSLEDVLRDAYAAVLRTAS